MSPRTALRWAAALTALILAVVGGVIARGGFSAGSTPATEPPSDIQATYEQRDRLLREQLERADHELATATARLATAHAALTAAPPSSPAAAPSPSPTLPPAPATPTAARPTARPVPQPTARPATPTPRPAPPTTAPPTSVPAGPPITAEQAAEIATAYVGGGTVTRVRLEEEDDRLVYEVRFADDSRVYVDAVTGQVVYARLR